MNKVILAFLLTLMTLSVVITETSCQQSPSSTTPSITPQSSPSRPPVPIPKLPSAIAEQHFERGIALSKKGENEEAVIEFTKAIELNSSYASAYFERGGVYSLKKDYDRAIADYIKARELNPTKEVNLKLAEAYTWRSDLLHLMAKYVEGDSAADRAIAVCNEIINQDSKEATAYRLIGRAYVLQEKYNQAISNLDKAVSLNPNDSESYSFRALSHWFMELPDTRTALADVTKALELNPKNSYAYSLRGTIYGYQKDYDLAIDDFTKSIEVNPDNPQDYCNRGQVYRMKFARSIALNQGEFNVQFAISLVRALEDFTKAIELNPSYLFPYMYRAVLLNSFGRYDESIADANKAITINPNYAKCYLVRGYCYYYQKRYDLALTDLNKVIALSTEPSVTQEAMELIQKINKK